MSRSEVVTDVSIVIQSIEQNGIQYIIDDVSEFVGKCLTLESGLTVLTSKRAIQAYDRDHPERIVCILVKPDRTIRVFVNNRESEGVDSIVTRFWNVDFKKLYSTISCGICYATSQGPGKGKCKSMSKSKRKQTLKVNVCSYCSFMTCETCLKKMNDIDAQARRCPHCRVWTLYGSEFGTPLDLLGVFPIRSTCDNPVDAFVDVISRLDGLVLVCPIMEDCIDPRNCMTVCKLSSTNRYTKCDLTLNELCVSLKKLWEKSRMELSLVRTSHDLSY